MAVVAPSIWTWSNALTVSRLIAAPVFCCALFSNAHVLAGLLFWGAVATDVADGRVARARGESSAFGGLLDHATDASFVTLGLAALSMQGAIPVALPVLVLVAFLQYMLDSKSLEGRTLRASFLGRWNGILYFVPLGVVATRDAIGLTFPAGQWVLWFGQALVFSTLVSMADRAWTLFSATEPSGN